MPIRLKRAYDDPSSDDGTRVLVERLWPRGVSKEAAQLDDWLKDAAPSTELRRWFAHDPDKWDEFRERYWAELDTVPDAWQPLLLKVQQGETVTFVFGSKEAERNSAAALQEYLENRM